MDALCMQNLACNVIILPEIKDSANKQKRELTFFATQDLKF